MQDIGATGPERLVDIAGLAFCPFHLPYSKHRLARWLKEEELGGKDPAWFKDSWPTSAKQHFEATVNSILERDSRVDLTGTVFPRPLVLSGHEYDALIADDCEFLAGINMRKCTCACIASFKNTLFRGENALFVEAHFVESIYFDQSRFLGITDFTKANFSGEHASFQGSEFHRDVNFTEANFSSVPNFEKVKFAKQVTFKGARFSSKGRISFDDSSFDEISFVNAQIGPCSFERTKFNGQARFSEARFVSSYSFEESIFLGDAIFMNTAFHPRSGVLSAGHIPRQGLLLSCGFSVFCIF